MKRIRVARLAAAALLVGTTCALAVLSPVAAQASTTGYGSGNDQVAIPAAGGPWVNTNNIFPSYAACSQAGHSQINHGGWYSFSCPQVLGGYDLWLQEG
jgi:hypothetical protein